jgi:hypothetical protein
MYRTLRLDYVPLRGLYIDDNSVGDSSAASGGANSCLGQVDNRGTKELLRKSLNDSFNLGFIAERCSRILLLIVD